MWSQWEANLGDVVSRGGSTFSTLRDGMRRQGNPHHFLLWGLQPRLPCPPALLRHSWRRGKWVVGRLPFRLRFLHLFHQVCTGAVVLRRLGFGTVLWFSLNSNSQNSSLRCYRDGCAAAAVVCDHVCVCACACTLAFLCHGFGLIIIFFYESFKRTSRWCCIDYR